MQQKSRAKKLKEAREQARYQKELDENIQKARDAEAKRQQAERVYVFLELWYTMFSLRTEGYPSHCIATENGARAQMRISGGLPKKSENKKL